MTYQGLDKPFFRASLRPVTREAFKLFNSRKHPMLSLILAFVISVCASSSGAQPLRVMGEEAQKPWVAVGHLQGPGYRLKRGCSGTLIAPDLVVTAAHCLTGAFGQREKQQFRAGLFKDRFAARRTYAQVDIHPLYSASRGRARIPHDIAVVHLSEPIPETEIAPIPLVSPVAPRYTPATLLGYAHTRPDVLSGSQNCAPLPAPHPQMLLFTCEVLAGTSGGAVIFDTSD